MNTEVFSGLMPRSTTIDGGFPLILTVTGLMTGGRFGCPALKSELG